MAGGAFCFGSFRLFVRERVLLKHDVRVSLGSRAFDVLVALVERAGETVNRAELFDIVWPDVVVTKVNLRVHIAGLRKALGDSRDGNAFIVSVAGRGYRFVAPVNRLQSAVPSPPMLSSPKRIVGRDVAIGTLSSQLSRKRFISLGGPGVWGRSIIAFAIAHTLACNLDDAVCVVDFAGIADPAQVSTAVASALGCEESLPLKALFDYLRDKEMLLVFDNCEHVFTGVAQFTACLSTEAPRIHVIISSEEAVQLSPLTGNRERSIAS